MRLLTFLAPLLLLAACAGTPSRTDLPQEPTPHTIHVIQYGWHTALLFDGKDILARSTKLAQDFKDHKYMLIGWGDGGYFVDDDPGVSQAVKALVASDYPALQAGGRETNPPLGVAPGDSIPLAVTERGYNQLVAYIDRSIATGADGKPVYLGKRLANLNLFYKGTGNYSLLNNCNSWVVGALRAAELPVSGFNLTARSVFDQARRISELQQTDRAGARPE